MAGGMGLSPGGGTKIPHASKILHAAEKKKKKGEKESQSGKKIAARATKKGFVSRLCEELL